MALKNKVVVIIGATGLLGHAVAKAFWQEGVWLVLVSSNPEALAAMKKEAEFRGTRVIGEVVDALDEKGMQTLAETVLDRFGRADILLHIVGEYRSGSLKDTTDEDWDKMLNTNLRTAVHSIRAFLPLLCNNNWGRIVTISSGITQIPPANVVAYVTAKAALETMTIAVAQEVKDKGVTSNVVLIRALDTPAERAKQPDKITGWVRPEDVAATLLFLCSDNGGAITGARIPVFGGN